jgi:hypothetical protein
MTIDAAAHLGHRVRAEGSAHVPLFPIHSWTGIERLEGRHMSCAWKKLGLAVLLVTTACSGSGGPSTTGSGSCLLISTPGGMLTSCVDFGAGSTPSDVMQSCNATMSIYSPGACPSANRVGRCELTGTRGGVSRGGQLCYYPPNTAADAMAACAMYHSANGFVATFVPN